MVSIVIIYLSMEFDAWTSNQVVAPVRANGNISPRLRSNAAYLNTFAVIIYKYRNKIDCFNISTITRHKARRIIGASIIIVRFPCIFHADHSSSCDQQFCYINSTKTHRSSRNRYIYIYKY